MNDENARARTPRSAPLLSVAVTGLDHQGVVLIFVTGELDLDTEEVMRAAVDRVAHRPGLTAVCLDLDEVSVIGAAGVRCLLACRTVIIGHGAGLVVVNPSAAVRQVLYAVGMAERLGLPADDPAPGERWETARQVPAGLFWPHPSGEALHDLRTRSVELCRASAEITARSAALLRRSRTTRNATEPR